ncbi:MAG: N-acyl homoserine lactonase family protein [Acidimicrobiales bacterium]|nr:N-acyl homoserine lactonase family protein [Acidimicrobiales bacterium]
MDVTIEPLACGTLTAGRSMFEAGGDDAPIEIPVPAWLIRHGGDLALFDCGMHRDLTAAGPAREVVELFFGLGVGPDDLIGARLEEAGVDPTDVGTVILSHLHFDHVGGLAQLPDARVLVQRDEWQAGFDDDLAAANSFNPSDYDLGHDIVHLDGEHDVFGDGRVVCIPTPGHTPGHQSLRVRLRDHEVVLCADCAYFSTTIDGGPLPPIGHDHAQQAASIERLRALRQGGAMLVPGHDPATFAQLPERLG